MGRTGIVVVGALLIGCMLLSAGCGMVKKSELETVQKDLAAAEAEAAQAEKANQKMAADLMVAQDKIKTLETEIKGLQGALSEATKQTASAERRMKVALAEKEKDAEKAKIHLTAAQDALAAAEKKVKSLNRQIGELNTRIKNLEMEIKSLKAPKAAPPTMKPVPPKPPATE